MNKRYSNLLTWRFRQYMLIRRRLTQWSVVWGVAALIALSWWQLRVHRVKAADKRVTVMETRYSPLKQMQSENERITDQLTKMNSHESLLTRLDDEQVPYRLLALVSLQVSERSGSVRIESFQLTQNDSGSASATSGPENDGGRDDFGRTQTRLEVRGIATDNMAISLFVAGLRDTGVFESVELKSSVGERVDNQRTQSFITVCEY